MSDRINVDFGGWIQKGFDLWKDNALTLIISGTIAIFVGIIAPTAIIQFAFKGLMIPHPKVYAVLTTFVGIIPGVLLAAPLMYAYVKMILALHDGTEPKPQVGDLFQGFAMLKPAGVYFLITNVVYFLLVLIGQVPCIGPLIYLAGGLAFATLTMFGLFFLVDRQLPVIDAYKASIDVVLKAFFPLMGLYIVAGLIGLTGIVGCGIGIFATIPIAFCVIACAYRAASGDGVIEATAVEHPTRPDDPPPAGTTAS